MASRIQGITVEIGGDTTKLSKALEGVNKSIKGTQSGLKDVNKLLKLDPSNTELVVQKQKIPESIWKNTPIPIQSGGVREKLERGMVNRRRMVHPTRKRIAGANLDACRMRNAKPLMSGVHRKSTMNVRWNRASWNCSTA